MSEDEDGNSLWTYVVRSIRPLRRDGPIAVQRAGPPVRIKQGSSTPVRPALPARTDAATDLDRRSDDRLRRGRMTIGARLDLHGMTLAQAQPRLRQFLIRAQGTGLRCVLVITGKGREGEGVIRQSLPRWLGDEPLRGIVLRHYPAKPKDGGAGAFYVLLRRVRT